MAGHDVGPPGSELGLRAGIVGGGFVAGVHADAARRAGARIAGVSSSTPDRGLEAATRFGAEQAFPDEEALIASPEVDVVHICTPNHLHVPLTLAALDAGKHVVCEKPLALDRTEAQDLCDAVDRSGTVATVPFVYRFYPMVREARARAHGGAVGAVRLVHGTYLQDWLSTAGDDNWRTDPALGGASRAFADIGAHWCDLLEFVTGDRLTAVCAELVTALPERVRHEHSHTFEAGYDEGGQRRAVTTEDIAILLFRTRQGVTGSLVVSQVSPGRKNGLFLEIAGADATVSFDQEHPDTLWVGRRGVSELVARDAGQLDASAAAYVTLPPGHPQGYQDCFDAFVADTYRAVAAGSVDAIDGLPGFADGARAVTVTDAVLRSAATRSWEEISSEGAVL